MLNNENFLALDGVASTLQSEVANLKTSKSDSDHEHDSKYAPIQHSHSVQDVESLEGLLAQKANLVHDHPQYLTDIPTHNHEMTDVNGLNEALSGKAQIDHTHVIDDTAGLASELASKATQYQVSSLMNMIPLTNMGSNPTDNTSVCEEAESESSSLEFTDWNAGGWNGVKLRLYALIEEAGAAHNFQPIDINISSDGIITSVKCPSGNHGVFIGA